MNATSRTLLAGIALAAAISGRAADSGAEPAVLENTALRLEIGKTPAPYLSRLTHKGSGQAVIAAPAQKTLFTITLAKEGGGTTVIDSAQAGESTVRVETGRLTIDYAKFASADLSVVVTATCADGNRLTLWTIRIENRTGRSIQSVRFPQFVAAPTIGDAADDVLVLPAMAGTLIENPAASWRDGQSVTLRYPGDMSSQFLSYQDRSAGVYMAGMDAEGHPMSLAVMKQKDGFRLWHEFIPVTQGTSWRSPYPVALGVTQGTWCDTADTYKQWAVRQAWCAKTLAKRSDIPAWWKEGPDVHVFEVRTYDGTRACNGSFYPQIRDYLRAWRAKIDGPVVAMLGGWENHRRWTAGDYFPVFDATNAGPAIVALKRDGFRPFFFLSGLFYTYRNEGRDGGEVPGAQRFEKSYVVDETSRQPKSYCLNESNPSGDWKRNSYQFCVGAPQTREFFLGVVDQSLDLGVDVLQMDQTTGGAGDIGFSDAHGHAPGVGLYQTRAFHGLLDAMRSRGKARSRDFVLFHEEPHEQLIPHLDGFHVREYFEKRWYRGQPGAVGIPLFDYLYHEYAIGYGGDSASLSKDNSRANVRAHAVNLVTGRTPGGSVWSSHANMFEAHTDQVAVVRSHCRLLKTQAKDFLMLGTMLHPYELKVPQIPIGIGVLRGGKWVRENVATPAILTSSWRSPDGRIGHLFVNIAETRQPLDVSLDTRNSPAFKVGDAEMYRSTTPDSFQPLWRNAALPKDLRVELEPLEVVFVEIRAAK